MEAIQKKRNHSRHKHFAMQKRIIMLVVRTKRDNRTGSLWKGVKGDEKSGVFLRKEAKEREKKRERDKKREGSEVDA